MKHRRTIWLKYTNISNLITFKLRITAEMQTTFNLFGLGKLKTDITMHKKNQKKKKNREINTHQTTYYRGETTFYLTCGGEIIP